MTKQRVLVAMSGGVDSSVAAWLLQQQGYDCVGATMRLFDAEDNGPGNQQDIDDAAAIAQRLGIPHHVLDCREAFDRDVVEAFVRAYERGVTPNPCTICNRRIKFGLLLERAHELGCDTVATGHYARIRCRPKIHAAGEAQPPSPSGAPATDCPAHASPVFELACARDLTKDQSYFLYSLTQDVLAHVLFPLGDLTKEGDIRCIAAEQGFSCARKRDSQGICFVPDSDFASFIERRRHAQLPEGDIVDTSGALLGHHRGAIRYTVGQRKGLGVAAAHPLYVTAIDARTNTVVLGDDHDLLASSLIADDWIWSAPESEMEALLDEAETSGTALPASAKIRYHQPHQGVRVTRVESASTQGAGSAPDGTSVHGDVPARDNAPQRRALRLDFDEPQRAIAPGQAVVLYRGDVVLGGGTVRCAC